MKTTSKRSLKPLRVTGMIIAFTFVIIAVVWSILRGYAANWTGFGDFTTADGEFFRGKTLWDWMELLIIPLSLLIGAYLLNQSERAVEREIATDRQQEAALQAYLDRMAELLLKENLRTSDESEEVRHVARTLTLTVLRVLDARRKGLVLQFLREADLSTRGSSIIRLWDAPLQNADLRGADLQGMNLNGADLTGADLSHAILLGATLESAKLIGTSLSGAALRSVDLKYADLTGADLHGANTMYIGLNFANLRDANLAGTTLVYLDDPEAAESLKGATMPDGTKHD